MNAFGTASRTRNARVVEHPHRRRFEDRRPQQHVVERVLGVLRAAEPPVKKD